MVADGCLMILGCTCQHSTFRRGRVGWCSWSLSVPWKSGAVWWAGAASWTRVSWRVQYCYRGCFLGRPEWQRQGLNWELYLQTHRSHAVLSPCHAQKHLLTCAQVSFFHCLSVNPPWPTCDVSARPRVRVVLAAVTDFSEVTDELELCLTHEIASVALLSHASDSSRGRNCLWLLLMQPVVLSSCLLADSVSAIESLKKQVKRREAHKSSSLLPTRKGKYVCKICLKLGASSLDELLFMSQNQPPFLLLSKE